MEFNPETPHPVVVFMPEGSTTHMGGTMRLGTRRTVLQTVECITAKLYQSDQYIDERHRHRYEVNPELVEKIEAAGMVFVGKDETGRRMEIVELEDHPYFVATQFHPEFKSRPGKPSPVFLGLVLAATGQLDSYLQGRKINREPK
uniref:CTP synthase (glutamine hydrolyzing) n=1 Tax=Pyramimonas obovata TaxID=1411642 RepID=A0A7S0REF5_9CHLO|mmetsp:Transcript_32302/g.70488  ORF Transcript_32302/g.70488 Transcript_32302/m.70488 type:complete len:145 (+) Transcript_32302:3-437(+)